MSNPRLADSPPDTPETPTLNPPTVGGRIGSLDIAPITLRDDQHNNSNRSSSSSRKASILTVTSHQSTSQLHSNVPEMPSLSKVKENTLRSLPNLSRNFIQFAQTVDFDDLLKHLTDYCNIQLKSSKSSPSIGNDQERNRTTDLNDLGESEPGMDGRKSVTLQSLAFRYSQMLVDWGAKLDPTKERHFFESFYRFLRSFSLQLYSTGEHTKFVQGQIDSLFCVRTKYFNIDRMPVKFRKTGSFKFSLSKQAQSTFLDIGMPSEVQPSKTSRRVGLKKPNKARNVGFGNLAKKRKMLKSKATAMKNGSDLNLDQLTMEAQLSTFEQKKQNFAMISGAVQQKNGDPENSEKRLADVAGSRCSAKSRKNFSIRQILDARSPIIASLLPPPQVSYDAIRKPTSRCQDSSSNAKPVISQPPPPSNKSNTHSTSTKPSYSPTTPLNPAKPVYSTPPITHLNHHTKPNSSRPTRRNITSTHPNSTRKSHSGFQIPKSDKLSKLTPLESNDRQPNSNSNSDSNSILNSDTIDLILQKNSGNKTLQEVLGIKV